MPYSYELDQCDVSDKKSLKIFREKREVWLSWFSHGISSSIENQLYNLMWWDATFWTLNEARKFADEKSPSSAITPILAGLIDQGYLALQILSLSKLVERNSADRSKGIISLRRVVDEIRENAKLFTRENYVAHDGLPFDAEIAYQKYLQEMEGKPRGAIWVAAGGSSDWAESRRMHEIFDGLSGIGAKQRSRTDVISERVLDSLEAVFTNQSIKHILNLRHKVFAHAADEYSRSRVATQIDRVEFGHIISSQKVLSQLMQVISADILSGPNFGSLIAIPQFNQFDHISLPYVRAKERSKLSEYWDKHVNERNGWLAEASKVILGF